MNQKILSGIDNALRFFQDLLLPNHCYLCGTPSSTVLCQPCHADLPTNASCCPRCALPQENAQVCAECLITPPDYDRVLSAFTYDGAVPYLINQFKHRGHLQLGKHLSSQLALDIADAELRPDALTAVPLHGYRRLQRGFNQSEVILQVLSQQLRCPELSVLHKIRATKQQQQLSRNQRLNNLRQSFAVKRDLKGLHIGLVDDVVTTSATVDTLSRLLRQAGAQKISVFCLARTPRPGSF